MSIFRKNKNSMKQADKELLFKIEEEKEGETILQNGKVWCETCKSWTNEVQLNDMKNYLCCSSCQDGLVMLS